MGTTLSFIVLTTCCCAAACFVGARFGKRDSVGVAMALSLAAATWFQVVIAGVPLNVQSAVASVVMVAFCVHSGKWIWSPLTLLDGLMATLVIWNVVSDSANSGFDAELPFRAYGEWALPYVTGRFAMMHQGVIARIAPWFAITAAAIGCIAVVESITNVNFWETLFVEVDDLVRTSRIKRFGLAYRAMGPTRHPIFLAVVLMLMIPWAVGWWESASTRLQKSLALLSAFGIGAGILSTLSRGPVFALALGLAFALAVVNRTARWILIIIAVVGGAVTYWKFDDIIAKFESTEGRRIVVEVDDEARIYSGTRNRLFVLEIYGPAVLRSGLFGYGTPAVSSFPPNIPGLPTEATSRKQLGIVDNSFILVGLRFGLIGAGILAAMFVAAIVGCLMLDRSAGTFFFPAGPRFTLAMAATLFAVVIEINTVFFSYDFAFWCLLTLGCVSGMQVRVKLVSAGNDD